MRILFHGPGLAIQKPHIGLQPVSGTQQPTISTFAELKQSHQLTGNRGNMIHAEAPAKLFAHDIQRSVYGNLATLHRGLGPAFADHMAENFDMIVISMANFIRTDHDGQHLLVPLKALDGRVPFIVLGAGLQGNPDPKQMLPGNLDLIAMFNEQARVFALRGRETALWLRKYGYENTTILGCPSLYAYPASIMALDYRAARARAAAGDARVLTAGYLKQMDNAIHSRGLQLIEAFRGIHSSYVMQDELFGFAGMQDIPNSFNEGRNEVDRHLLETRMLGLGAPDLPFERYYYFMESSGWRQAAMAHDLFLGDRFHGGVAALQAGVPAVFLSHDNRVAELTKFFGLPALSTKAFMQKGLQGTLEEMLSDEAEQTFKTRYISLHNRFRQFFAGHGLEVKVRPPGPPQAAGQKQDRITTRVSSSPEQIAFAVGQTGTLRIGDIYGKYHFSDVTKPLVISFSHLGGSVDENLIPEQKSPWAFDYLRKRDINCLSFSGIKGHNNFYRDEEFIAALDKISAALPDFPERLGYGTSMGAYAAAAYATPLKITRLLLGSPISTRNRRINTWDFAAGRSLPSYAFEWEGPYFDAAQTTARGYVLYDPLYALDAIHARRFTSLTPVKLPGAGHTGMDLLAQLKVLDEVFMGFYNDNLDLKTYYRKIRGRQMLAPYFTNGLLGRENSQITPERRQTIKRWLEKNKPELLAQIPAERLERTTPRPPRPVLPAAPAKPAPETAPRAASGLLHSLRRLIGRG